LELRHKTVSDILEICVDQHSDLWSCQNMQPPLQKDVNYVAGAWPSVVFFKACFSWQSVFGLLGELHRILPLARFYEVIYKLYLRGWRNVSFFVTLKSRVEVIVTCRVLLN